MLRCGRTRRCEAAFEAKARARLEELQGELEGQEGVVAIEPESGEYFVGATLGKANAAAFAKLPRRVGLFRPAGRSRGSHRPAHVVEVDVLALTLKSDP